MDNRKIEETLAEIGRTLKAKRESFNLSVKDVHTRTRIPVKFVQGLESGVKSDFPAEVYFVGTMKRYAQFLSLNGDSLVLMYKNAGLPQEKAPVPQEQPLPSQKVQEKPVVQKHAPKTKTERPGPRLSASVNFDKVLYAVVIAFISFIIISAVYNIWQKVDPDEQEIIVVSTSTVSVPVSTAPVKDVQQQPAAASRPVQPQAKSQPLPASPVTALRLSVESMDNSWIKVRVDDVLMFEGTMTAGMKRDWTGKDKINLIVGYAPGVRVLLNGNPVDVTKGAVKDINDLTFTAGQK